MDVLPSPEQLFESINDATDEATARSFPTIHQLVTPEYVQPASCP